MRGRAIATCESGGAAVEFAIIAPVFFMTLFSLVGYGIYLGAAHSVQQMAADAARTAVAGLDSAERKKLVQEFLTKTTMNNTLLDRSKLNMQVVDDPQNPNQFTVSIDYDTSSLPIVGLYSYAMPDTHIRRNATMRMGGV